MVPSKSSIQPIQAHETNRSWRTSDEFSDFVVGGFPEKAQQGRNTAAVPQRHLVVVRSLAIDQVPQGPTGALLDLRDLVVQLVHQVLDPTQVAHLRTSHKNPDQNTSFNVFQQHLNPLESTVMNFQFLISPSLFSKRKQTDLKIKLIVGKSTFSLNQL